MAKKLAERAVLKYVRLVNGEMDDGALADALKEPQGLPQRHRKSLCLFRGLSPSFANSNARASPCWMTERASLTLFRGPLSQSL